jgi:uncharacterized membrane protein
METRSAIGRCRKRIGTGQRWFAGLALMLAALTGAAGCTAVPHHDLTAYRKAFTEAREASMHIINDLGLAWHESAAVLLEGDHDDDDDWQAFDPAKPAQPLTIDEQVLVRHQLWLVTGRYNDALAALAEGRSREQVEGLVNGFLASVRELPFRKLADLAAGAHPLAGVISESLFLIEREVQARQFHRAVEAGGPLVDAILLAMQQEISDHYDLRLVLNTRARRELEAGLQMDLLPSFLDIYESTGAHEDKQPALDAMNDALSETFRYRDDQLLNAMHDDAAAPPSPAERSQLMMIAGEVKSKGEQYAAFREELLSYQQVLKLYYELLDIARYRMALLRQVAAEGGEVPVDDLLLAAIRLHWQFTKYRNARTGR